MRRIVGVLVAVLIVGACSQGPSQSEKLSAEAKAKASRAKCVKSFEDFDQKVRDARNVDGPSADFRPIIQTWFQESVTVCPSRAVWEEVAEEVDPNAGIDLTDPAERASTWRGMCSDFPYPFTPPACETYRE